MFHFLILFLHRPVFCALSVSRTIDAERRAIRRPCHGGGRDGQNNEEHARGAYGGGSQETRQTNVVRT